MTAGLALDTRSARVGSRFQSAATTSTSQGGSPGLTFFRRAVHEIIRGGHRDRSVRRASLIERLRASREPLAYVNVLMEECVANGGPDGLDIAIDILAKLPEITIQYAREFWRQDNARWERLQDIPRHQLEDDIWYVLLRAAGVSGMDAWPKSLMLLHCAVMGTQSIREAAIHAMGDMGGQEAIKMVRRIRTLCAHDPVIRETATQVLGDLEG